MRRAVSAATIGSDGTVDHMSSVWSRPVLSSVASVVEASRHVSTSPEAIARAASWMAYEEFTMSSGGAAGPFDFGSDADTIIDVTLLAAALDFAFTDFDTGVKYQVEYQGRMWSDAEAMFARLHQAIGSGMPLLDGEYLATVHRSDLESIFRGNIEMPMLDERAQILNAIGAVLVDRYHGRFHEFVGDCAPAMYAAGDGLLERLIVEFPRFNDASVYAGHDVQFHKLAQLGLWSLHRALHASGGWTLRDLDHMTAFADYIVPVALRLMGILEYTKDLENRINEGHLIPRDSDEEIEIRAHTLYATALLTDEINRIRPAELRLVIPQVDYRLWSTYHTTFWPHHLTNTTMY